MTITIPTSFGEFKQVEAEPTCSPYFVIHPTLTRDGLDPDLFTITHLPSAYSVLQRVEGRQKARLCAAVFAGLPVRWDKIKNLSTARRHFKTMPAWVTEWRRQVTA